MNEKEEYNYGIPITDKYRITSMIIFKHSFNTVVLKNVTYYQPNISNVWDFRLLNEFDLTFDIIYINLIFYYFFIIFFLLFRFSTPSIFPLISFIFLQSLK